MPISIRFITFAATFPSFDASAGVLRQSRGSDESPQFRGNFCNDRCIPKPRSTLMQLTRGRRDGPGRAGSGRAAGGETTKPSGDERRSNRDSERP